MLYDAWILGDPQKQITSLPIAFLLLVLLFQRTKVTLVVASLIIAGLLYRLHVIRDRETEALRPYARIARQVMALSWKTGGDVSHVGKTLVWDVKGDRLSGAHYRIPFSLRAVPGDASMTIFMVWDTRSQKVKTYVAEKDPSFTVSGIQDTVDVAVIRWPEKVLLARQSLVGGLPPEEIRRKKRERQDEHGKNPLVDWIRATQRP